MGEPFLQQLQPFPGQSRSVQQAIPDGREFSVEALRPYQSLAVVVRWPKGYVQPPQWWDPAHLPFVLAPLALLAFYVAVRLFLRRHQERATVVPQYTPPRGLSPAALRYVLTGGADGTSVAAVLAAFVTKGAISATAPSEVQLLNGSIRLVAPNAVKVRPGQLVKLN